ncbi:MAG: hypothetical protein IJF71_02825 [Clostridia bacterium]|nr:hypothetical protein [Clostridia bacterium]
MPAVVFGVEHFLYMGITGVLALVGLYLAKKYAKTEKSQAIILKALAAALFASVMINRLSQVFRYGTVRWNQIIPDSYCSMTSLVLSLAVMFGKKDNDALHFTWILAIFGGISTVIYPAFIGQGPTVFYIPTITGLLHHSLSATTAIAVLMFGWMRVTYKKWYCTLFGFTCYLTVGAFLIGYLGISDAYHIYTPLLDGTPLTTWVMAPMYAVCYALILWIIELVRKKKARAGICNVSEEKSGSESNQIS